MTERNYTKTGIVAPDDIVQPSQAPLRNAGDIVTRLRLMAGQVPGITYHDLPPASTLADAADEIERLRALMTAWVHAVDVLDAPGSPLTAYDAVKAAETALLCEVHGG